MFPNRRGKPPSDATLSQLIKELGIAAVPHGFRSSFRDWAAEQTNTPREVVEAALAHTVRNPTEAAYPDFVTFVLDSADFRGFRRESPMNPGRPGWPGAV